MIVLIRARSGDWVRVGRRALLREGLREGLRPGSYEGGWRCALVPNMGDCDCLSFKGCMYRLQREQLLV